MWFLIRQNSTTTQKIELLTVFLQLRLKILKLLSTRYIDKYITFLPLFSFTSENYLLRAPRRVWKPCKDDVQTKLQKHRVIKTDNCAVQPYKPHIQLHLNSPPPPREQQNISYIYSPKGCSTRKSIKKTDFN